MEITDILMKIRKIVRSINLESKKIQKEYGVSIPQILCLGFLHQSSNFQRTQGEIRKFLNLNPSTLTGIIDRLEKNGLVARLPKSGDKRVVHISLTSRGDDLYNKLPPLLHEHLSEKLTRLEESELIQIEESLNTLINLLDIDRIEASPVITMDDALEDDNINETY